jgi:hypothetical protein
MLNKKAREILELYMKPGADMINPRKTQVGARI